MGKNLIDLTFHWILYTTFGQFQDLFLNVTVISQVNICSFDLCQGLLYR